jgi:hypothetical protein
MRKVMAFLIVALFGLVLAENQDTTSVSESRNVKGGIEMPAIEVKPNNGNWQPARKHVYNKDTVFMLITTRHSTSSGLGWDTIMNKRVYVDSIKADSLPTGDSLGGKPCYQTKELRNVALIFGFVHDTGVAKR